jgi:hypothetical protein
MAGPAPCFPSRHCGPADTALHLIGQGEKRLGHAERLADLRQRNTVVADLEEANLHCRLPQLFGNLTFSFLKI